MAQSEVLVFPDGTEVAAFFTKGRRLAVHRPLGSKKDYIVTHVPDHAIVLRTRLKGDGTSAAKALEWLFDRLKPEEIEMVVRRLVSVSEY